MTNNDTSSIKMAPSDHFLKTLKTRVDHELKGQAKRDHPRHYLKCLFIFLFSSLSYYSLYYIQSGPLLCLLAIITGISFTALGFNLFHDSIHGSLSKSRNLNRFFAFLTCSNLGVGHYFWRHKHNYLHHQFPNIQDWDDDLETRDALRLSPEQPWSARYYFQHLYAPFAYGLTTIEWVFIKDFVQYFTLKLNEKQKIPKLKFADHIEFWSSKFIYLALFFVLPLTYFPLKTFLIGFVLFHFSMSLSMAAVFQLAHIFEESSYPLPNQQTKKIPMNWAELQLSTTMNFATKNRFLNWFSGGLNFQVEHHLFPLISHIHYPKIAPIVEQTAKEFNYPYYSTPSYFTALKSHFKSLKKFGRNQQIIQQPEHLNL